MIILAAVNLTKTAFDHVTFTASQMVTGPVDINLCPQKVFIIKCGSSLYWPVSTNVELVVDSQFMSFHQS
jgi:hypothetical protein